MEEERAEKTLSSMFQEDKRFVDYIKVRARARVCGGHVRADMQMIGRQFSSKSLTISVRFPFCSSKKPFLDSLIAGSARAPIPRSVRQTED